MTELVTLAGTAVHRINSPHVAETLKVQVGLPIGYETSDADYPVVYLIDGPWYFAQVFEGALAMSLAGELPPVLIIGIGYEPQLCDRAAEFKRVSALRCRDLTPTRDTSEWWRVAGASEPIATTVGTGNAPQFLRAITEDIKTLVSSCYRVKKDEEVLAGFSLGALFALDALFSNPQGFKGYLCASPSLWWHERVIFAREAQYAARSTDLATTLYLSVGELEGDGPGAAAHMVDNLLLFARQLESRHYPHFKCHCKVFDGDTHATSAGPAFAQGLKAIFKDSPSSDGGVP